MDKKRCNNYTHDEIEGLLTLVEEHKDVIECKKTDCISNTKKEAEWKIIETKFNVLYGSGRTGKMLRNKWDSLKKRTKKDYADIKTSLYRTGGGPHEGVKLSGIGSRVLGLVGVGVTGFHCEIDSDAAGSGQANAVINEEDTVETVADNIDINEVSVPQWNSWNPSQLRQPKHKALMLPLDSPSTSTGFGSDTCMVKSMVPEDDVCLTPHTSNVAKRKRTNKKESMSSRLVRQQQEGSVYEELARKKMELIDLQLTILKEEAKMKAIYAAEKHELEIKILQKDLENKTK